MGNTNAAYESQEEKTSKGEDETLYLLKSFGHFQRVSRFSIKEIRFLFSKFKYLSGGKNNLTFQALMKMRGEFVKSNQTLCKRLFQTFVWMSSNIVSPEKKEEGMSFLEFLIGCSAFARGSLEEQLSLLFKAMKGNKEERMLDRKDCLEFAELVRSSFQSRKLSEGGAKYAESVLSGNIVADVDFSLFSYDENIILSEKQFVLKALSSPSAQKCLSIMERFFFPMVRDLKTVENFPSSFSLEYTTKTEGTMVPKAVTMICRALEKKALQYEGENERKRLYSELSSKQDEFVLEALISLTEINSSEELDSNELSFVCLLHFLREEISKFPSPLFTFAFTEEFCMRSFDKEKLFHLSNSLLQRLPPANFFTSRRILETIRFVCFKDEYLFTALTYFFYPCFFRMDENAPDSWKKNAKTMLTFILKNLNLFQTREEMETEERDFSVDGLNPKIQNRRKDGTIGAKMLKIAISNGSGEKGMKFRSEPLLRMKDSFSILPEDSTILPPPPSLPPPVPKTILIALHFVLHHLPLSDLLKCRQVSKIWNKILQQSSAWRNLLHVDLHTLTNWFHIPQKRELAEKLVFSRKDLCMKIERSWEKSVHGIPSIHSVPISQRRFSIVSTNLFQVGVIGRKEAGISSLMASIGRMVDIVDINSHSFGLSLETYGKISNTETCFALNLIHINDPSSLILQKDLINFFQGFIFVFPVDLENKEQEIHSKVANSVLSRKSDHQAVEFVATNFENTFKEGFEAHFFEEKFSFLPKTVSFTPVSPNNFFNVEYLFSKLIHDLFSKQNEF